jgi:hypothetical protein
LTTQGAENTIPEAESAAVRVMNRAFEADRGAVHALMCNRVPCNQALADDPTVVCDDSSVGGGFTVGMLGFLNGLLGEMGLPLVAAKWSDNTDPEGRRTLLGFQEYQPPSLNTLPTIEAGD